MGYLEWKECHAISYYLTLNGVTAWITHDGSGYSLVIVPVFGGENKSKVLYYESDLPSVIEAKEAFFKWIHTVDSVKTHPSTKNFIKSKVANSFIGSWIVKLKKLK